MTQDNPYAASTLASSHSIDPRLLNAVAERFAQTRRASPTVIGSLLLWPGTPLLVLTGVAGTAILAFFASVPGSEITAHFPIGLAAMVFGAVLRDIGLARRVKRLWPAQSHFIDWDKVDEFIQ